MKNQIQAILQRLENIESQLEKIQAKISMPRIQKGKEQNVKSESTQIEGRKDCVTETKFERLKKQILFSIQVIRFLMEAALFF
jgi:uncharacterized membrane protein